MAGLKKKKISFLSPTGMAIWKDREERSFRMMVWGTNTSPDDIKRRSQHTRTPLKQPQRWGTGISGQSRMNFAYLEVSANGSSKTSFPEEAMIQDNSWLVHFLSVFWGSGRREQLVFPITRTSSSTASSIMLKKGQGGSKFHLLHSPHF